MKEYDHVDILGVSNYGRHCPPTASPSGEAASGSCVCEMCVYVCGRGGGGDLVWLLWIDNEGVARGAPLIKPRLDHHESVRGGFWPDIDARVVPAKSNQS